MPYRLISPALFDVEASLRLMADALSHEPPESNRPSEVVLELGGVRGLTAGGLGQLVNLHNRLAASGRRLVVRKVGREAYEAVAATGLTDLLDVRRDEGWPSTAG